MVRSRDIPHLPQCGRLLARRASLAVVVLIGVGVNGCAGSGDDALRKAKSQIRTAPYLVVSDARGDTLLSAGLTVIRRRGRVVAWTRGEVEFVWDSKRRCYTRHTKFNRDDIRQLRSAALPNLDGH